MIGSMMRRAMIGDGSTLNLDFTTGVLDSRLTFTRAANTATVINSSGLVQTVNADIPRFDHDPTTLAPRGLLIEGAATNLLQQSADWTVSPWSKPAQITWDGTTYAIAPDGTNTAKQVTVTGGSSASVAQGVANATNRTVSLWIRAGSLTQFSVGAFDATGGTTWGNNADSTCRIISGPGSVSQQVGGLWLVTGLSTTQWTRVEVFRASSYGALLVYPGGTGSVTGTAFLWGMQMEAGNGASSLIPTTTSQETRNADECSMTGSNFSDWFNASEGTFLARFRPLVQTAGGLANTIVSANDNTANEQIALASITNGRLVVIDGGSALANVTSGTVTLGSVARLAGAYKLNDCQSCTGGTLGTADTSVTLPTVNRLFIGRSAGATPTFLRGHIESFKFYPTRLPDATLQSLTT